MISLENAIDKVFDRQKTKNINQKANPDHSIVHVGGSAQPPPNMELNQRRSSIYTNDEEEAKPTKKCARVCGIHFIQINDE